MKKLVLAILAVGSIATAQAQRAGSMLIYGNIGFEGHKSTDDAGLPGSRDVVTKNSRFDFNPGFGYQFNKWVTIGLDLGLSTTRATTEHNTVGVADPVDRSRDFRVGPFVRFTMPINKTFFVYQQVNLSYLTGKSTTDFDMLGVPDAVSHYNGVSANWFPAVGVNFTKCMALNFSFGGLGYRYAKTQFDDVPGRLNSETVRTNDFMFNFGQQINIGISANLGGCHKRVKGHHQMGEEHRHMDMNDDDSDMPKKKKKSADEDEE